MSDVAAAERRVLAGPDDVAQAGAALFREAAREAIAAFGRFTVALAGGSTPRRMYEMLAAEPGVDWENVQVFWGDERCVPPDHPGSNYRLAEDVLLGRVPVLRANVHRIRGEEGATEAAIAYARELAGFFGADRPVRITGASTFDLVLLGMGEDGHTASLFPGAQALHATGWTVPARAPAGLPVPERVTLTLPTIAGAERVVFLVTGAAKAGVAARALAGDRSLPAARVSARRELLWLLDRSAAGRLTSGR